MDWTIIRLFVILVIRLRLKLIILAKERVNNMEMGRGWKKWYVTEDYITNALEQLSSAGVTEIFVLNPVDPKERLNRYFLVVYYGIEEKE